MFKLNRCIVSFLLLGSVFFFVSCEKDFTETITSNDGVQARLAYTEKGYSEIEVNPIVWQIILNLFILTFRPSKTAKAYKEIWMEKENMSPLRY